MFGLTFKQYVLMFIFIYLLRYFIYYIVDYIENYKYPENERKYEYTSRFILLNKIIDKIKNIL